MTDVKNGDRVRVVLEGEVSHARQSGFYLDSAVFVRETKQVKSVEVVKPAVEQFKTGDIVALKQNVRPYARLLGDNGYWLIPLKSHLAGKASYKRYGRPNAERSHFNSGRYERVALTPATEQLRYQRRAI